MLLLQLRVGTTRRSYYSMQFNVEYYGLFIYVLDLVTCVRLRYLISFYTLILFFILSLFYLVQGYGLRATATATTTEYIDIPT